MADPNGYPWGYAPPFWGSGHRQYGPGMGYAPLGFPTFDAPGGRARHRDHYGKRGQWYREWTGDWNLDRERMRHQLGRNADIDLMGPFSSCPIRRPVVPVPPRRRVRFPYGNRHPAGWHNLNIDRVRQFGPHLLDRQPDYPLLRHEHYPGMWADPYESDHLTSGLLPGRWRAGGLGGRRMQSPSALSFTTEDLAYPYGPYAMPFGRDGLRAPNLFDEWEDIDDDEAILDDFRERPDLGFGPYGRRDGFIHPFFPPSPRHPSQIL